MAERHCTIRHRTKTVDGISVFYREAGRPDRGTIVLLPGHPSGAHAYDELIERLAPDWHVVAPDYPGYGFSEAPADAPWTFDWLAEVVDHLLEALALERYALYMWDFGAPVGFRIAVAHPERVAGIVTQNGNIYMEGLGPATAPLGAWWEDKAAGQADIDGFLSLAGTRMQWEAGARDAEAIDPAKWTLDQTLLDSPGHKEAAEALVWDYQNNPPRYAEWQAYLREHQPPLTAVWGKNDPFFIPAGAEAYARDVEGAEVFLLDTGHCALAEEVDAIAGHVRALLRRAYPDEDREAEMPPGVHLVDVAVLSPEARQIGVAEFLSRGHLFASTHIEEGELVMEFEPDAVRKPFAVQARSFNRAMFHARRLLE
jgi:pimeloyl-ACP methyl ester carboxylesterase